MENQESGRKKIVVIGGGSGTYSLLQGLKKHWQTYDIVKIVSMADSGGSTGRLRDEFGQLPIGDARMGLAALAPASDHTDQLLRELFLYRFDKGEGLSGHNFGNLFLVALTDILGSEAKAIKAAARILRLRGEVLPVTEDNVHLVATYEDGVTVVGEHDIDEPALDRENARIVELVTDKTAHIGEEADQAIRTADLIVLGPGDLYTSLLANSVIKGFSEAIQASKGKFVFVLNLMTRPGQTRGMQATDYYKEIKRYSGRPIDAVLVNTTPLPADILERYQLEGDIPVENDIVDECPLIEGDFLAEEVVERKQGDILKRSLIRHDADKLTEAILKLV